MTWNLLLLLPSTICIVGFIAFSSYAWTWWDEEDVGEAMISSVSAVICLISGLIAFGAALR